MTVLPFPIRCVYERPDPAALASHIATLADLSAAEYGAYMRLVLQYWLLPCLPDDDERLARLTGQTVAEWKKCRPAVAGHFDSAWVPQWMPPLNNTGEE
jgi:hypothetical protein